MYVDEVRQEDKRTPLNYAVYHGHHEIVALLIAKGANLDGHGLSNPLVSAFCIVHSF